jgi:hypothetical protein
VGAFTVTENDRAALDAEAVQVLGEVVQSVEPLAHATRTTATDEVCRVRSASQSAVVKVLSATASATWPGSDEPSHPGYWLREAELYREGLPSCYRDADVVMPELLGAFDRSGAVSLWLEDVRGISGSELSPSSYGRVAARLGRAQCRGRCVPERVSQAAARHWSKGFLRSYLDSWNGVGWSRVHHDDDWELPLVRASFVPSLRAKLVRLCADRHQMLGWADLLPQTICHHDVWLNNIFDRDDHTVLIDWAFAGYGHLGADVGNLVTDSCGDLLQPTELLPELDASATRGYRMGLEDAGWVGDFRQVRLGMCLMAAKWSWLVPHMLTLARQTTHRVYGGVQTDSEHLFAERAAMFDYLADLADEARSLAEQLGL